MTSAGLQQLSSCSSRLARPPAGTSHSVRSCRSSMLTIISGIDLAGGTCSRTFWPTSKRVVTRLPRRCTCRLRPCTGPVAIRHSPGGRNRIHQRHCRDGGERPLRSDARLCRALLATPIFGSGAEVEAVLERHIRAGGDRFRGIRHLVIWDADSEFDEPAERGPPALLADARFREGFSRLAPLGLTFDAWLFHPQLDELTDLARRLPRNLDRPRPRRRHPRDRTVCGAPRRSLRTLVQLHPCARHLPERLGQARRPRHAHQRIWFRSRHPTRHLPRRSRRLASLH